VSGALLPWQFQQCLVHTLSARKWSTLRINVQFDPVCNRQRSWSLCLNTTAWWRCHHFLRFPNHGYSQMHSSCYTRKSPGTLSSGEQIILLCSYDHCLHFVWLRNLHPSPNLFLNSSSLPSALSVMFLGSYFNCKRSSELHSKWLRIKCRQSLNVLKVLCTGSWCWDYMVTLRLLRALISCKIGYGSFVYGPAKKSIILGLSWRWIF
jgi:hypothetical protein